MSAAALLLGLAVSVIPAVLVAKRMPVERPAQLLLPKPPAGGSKILLERIKPLWSRLNFTQKVTCCNLPRYKKRMIMTVVGVAGAVCLMFCVQSAGLIDQVNVIVKSLNKIVFVLIVVAVLLAVVIVYNLVTINVTERIRKLSTIKVLGFLDNEVSMYIYRETIINSLIGVPVGWLLG